MRLPNGIRDKLSGVRLPESRRFWITTSAVVLGIEVVLSFALWGWLSGDDSASTTIRNIGFIMAGSVALPLAIWRGVVADRQASAAQRQAETALEQANTAQQTLLNERYQQGAEMLGSGVLSVRLGGIYALERLAKEHPEEYHIQIMELLCSFVRHPTKTEGYETKLAVENADPHIVHGLREDVKAIMQWIGSRCKTQLELEKSQEFKLDLKGADLSSGQIGDANLSGAMLHYANLSNTNIFSVDLSQAYLNHAVLRGAELNDVNFTGASASGVDLSDARMNRVIMPKLSLNYANLSGVQLYDVNLSGAFIQHADLPDVYIEHSDLSDTHFLDSKLPRAVIQNSDLSRARILRTDMSGANIRGTNLSGTYFYNPDGGADTSSVTGVTQAQLDEACADPDNSPKLDGVHDAKTGEQLVWRGKPCEG